jgi:hypothetical protein
MSVFLLAFLPLSSCFLSGKGTPQVHQPEGQALRKLKGNGTLISLKYYEHITQLLLLEQQTNPRRHKSNMFLGAPGRIDNKAA